MPYLYREKEHSMGNANADFFHAPYGRLREMLSTATGTRLFISYVPRFWKLAYLRVSVIPDDMRGLRRRELDAILRAFLPYQLRIVELAIDFPWRTRR